MKAKKKKAIRLGMNEQEVRGLFATQMWGSFLKWMEGQTGAIDPDTGERLYYHHDVLRFVDMKLRNRPTHWD